MATTYKTSFNGLQVSVKGVYSAYNLNDEELESLKRTFGPNCVNGSKGNYTVFKKAQRHVYLNLFIHILWKPVQFDIRNDLLTLFGSERIEKKKIEKLTKKLKNMRIELHVEEVSGSWNIVDYDKFLDILKVLIAAN